MATIDYGVVVFKNGKRYKEEELFPYIDELNVCFCKTYMHYPLSGLPNGGEDGYYWFGYGDGKKSYRFTHNGSNYYVKEICDRVYRCQVNDVDGNRFFIILGYGIDNDKCLWNDIKYIYHNKKSVRKIENILRRFDW